jgi:hypothetical protein
MKKLLLAAVVVGLGLPSCDKADLLAKERAIREHRVIPGMRDYEVRRALGKANEEVVISDSQTAWLYEDGQQVLFAHGRAVESKSVAPAANPPAISREPRARGNHNAQRMWSQLPSGEWVEHDRSVSGLQSVGGGGNNYARFPTTPTPDASSTISKQWGWDERGSPLDKRPRSF